ncbi:MULTISPECIES: hypothetical protein [Antarcticibacterium]|nr:MULTISPECIES: hypothetical protein [Antarcticibacterium]
MRKGFAGITLWPFVILRNKGLKQDPVFLNHERIHYKQQAELLVIPFYIWYFLEFILKYAFYKDPYLTYRNLSFEREAYSHERDLAYCSKRKLWSFTRFLSRKA